MNTQLKSILIAGAVGVAMMSSIAVHAKDIKVKPAQETTYRFATVIKTQSVHQEYDIRTVSSVDLKTQLIYSPDYKSLESCEKAKKDVSALLGQNVTVVVDERTRATETYKQSECSPNMGP